MSKKVLVISSTPKNGGNSDLLCNQFAKGACDAEHIAKKVCLRTHNIAP